MDDKEYLKRLKEDDYIAWDSIENDPMVAGVDSGSGCYSNEETYPKTLTKIKRKTA